MTGDARTRSSMMRLSTVTPVCLALAAIITFAPGGAFARGGSHGGGGHFGGGHFGHSRGGGRGPGFGFYPSHEYEPGCVWVRRLVPMRYGLRWRRVAICY
jgi:hypothetical protein